MLGLSNIYVLLNYVFSPMLSRLIGSSGNYMCSLRLRDKSWPQLDSISIPQVWWLILCVNIKVYQKTGKRLCLVCLWGCFWKRLASESVDWVKRSHLYQHRQVASGPLVLNRAERWRKGKFALSWARTSSFFFSFFVVFGFEFRLHAC
jgi:hypothetical protein